MPRASKGGYIFLVTVLIVGVVASAIVASLLYLATSAGRLSLTLEQSSRAVEYAYACADNALKSLRATGGYAGGETLTFGSGSCRILTIGGNGYADRTLCVEGMAGAVTRRMEIVLATLLPSVSVTSWDEVPAFTLCSN